MPLSLSESRRQIEDLGRVLPAEVVLHSGKALCLGCVSISRQGRVGRHHQLHSMWVIKQQTANQGGQVATVFHSLPQGGDHRLKIECGNRVTVMGCRAKGSQHQVEPVGHTVATHFTLMQLYLPQDGVDLFFADALRCDPLDAGQHLCLKGVGVVCLTAFNTAAEHHFPHGFF